MLVQNQFLMRSICSNQSSDGEIIDRPDFNLPNLNLKAIIQITQGGTGNPGDSKIYWRVNFDRFIQDLR